MMQEAEEEGSLAVGNIGEVMFPILKAFCGRDLATHVFSNFLHVVDSSCCTYFQSLHMSICHAILQLSATPPGPVEIAAAASEGESTEGYAVYTLMAIASLKFIDTVPPDIGCSAICCFWH
jgi:hypothetical protein